MKTKHPMKIKRNNAWKISTIVLGILFILSLYFNVMNSNSSAQKSSKVSIDFASKKAINVINNNLLQTENKATLVSKNEQNGLYKITLQINDKNVESYVSIDGKLLFVNPIDLDNPPEAQQKQQSQGEIEVSSDDDQIKGNENAPVTIVEFSDFECPFCGRYFSQTYRQIEEEYIKTGKVKYVFRDFPLSSHKKAQKAAEAAECTGEQGKFWEMHDKLFENQNALDIDNLKQYAKDLDLNIEEFNDCLDSGKMTSEVQKDFEDGKSYGVTGTPAFYINGRSLTGAQPFEKFKQIIEAELAK